MYARSTREAIAFSGVGVLLFIFAFILIAFVKRVSMFILTAVINFPAIPAVLMAARVMRCFIGTPGH